MAELFKPYHARDNVKLATNDEAKWFHTKIAKMLYLLKRVRPECLTTVSFLTTRFLCCDVDDLVKLRRPLGYIFATREPGIVIKVGVHEDSDGSHGEVCMVFGKSSSIDVSSIVSPSQAPKQNLWPYQITLDAVYIYETF